MIVHEIKLDEHDEPVLTVTVTGGSDVWRLAHHLMQGQIEFGILARDVFVFLRRRWGIRAFRKVDQEMTGGFITKHSWHLERRD